MVVLAEGLVEASGDDLAVAGPVDRSEDLVLVPGVGLAEAVRGVMTRLGVVVVALRGDDLVGIFLVTSAVAFFTTVDLVTLAGAVAGFLGIDTLLALVSVVVGFAVVVLGRVFLTGDCGSSTIAGMDSPIFSISSSRASIASTESSIRETEDPVVNLIGDRNTIFSAKESSCLTTIVVTVALCVASVSKQSFGVIFAGVRVSMVATNESSPSSFVLVLISGILWSSGLKRGVRALADFGDSVLSARLTALEGGVCGRASCIGT